MDGYNANMFEERLDSSRMNVPSYFQQRTRVPISLQIHKHLILLVFLILLTVALVGGKGCLIAVLTGIFLTTNDMEPLRMHLLVLHVFFGERSICTVWPFLIWITCLFYS